MVIYEVNLEVQSPYSEKFASWLQKHIQEMLNLPYFEKVYLFTEEDQKKKDAGELTLISWIVHYYAKDEESLEDYFQNHAAIMRQDGL